MAFKCPHCREETILLTQKYRLGWWMTSTCNACGGRIGVFPWTLMIITMFHVWNVLWWVGLVHFNDSYHYLIYLAICWILIDLINLYFMPLCRLRKIE